MPEPAKPDQPAVMLLLGGTREARELAERLANDKRWSVISSLAGRTTEPEVLKGEVRVGGFGGVGGLVDYMTRKRVDLVVDATHPFAETISANAMAAARQLQRPFLRLCRPPWQCGPSDRWLRAANVDHAVQLIEAGSRALLTIGRQEIGPFLQRDDVAFIARMIEPPEDTVPSHMELILERPPFSVADERALLSDKRIDVLVTKNAGGTSVASKLVAARELGLPVIMIDRPDRALPIDAETVDDFLALLDSHHAT